MNKPVILLGAGGHASVLCDTLKQLNIDIIAVVAPDLKVDELPKVFHGINRLDRDEQVLDYNPESILLVNGIGSMPESNVRARLYDEFNQKGYEFMTVVSPMAYVSPYATLSQGVQIMPGAVVQTGVKILENTIINTKVSVDHDCIIGRHCHIAPGAVLSGDSILGNNVHIGTGASVIENIVIKDDSVVGAGACLTRNIDNASIIYPAKIFVRELNK